ncbi:hypothetical protein NQZ79_g8339 [Umbelopsis isabellina]|nr:hypothetical protein NQZ79_g8339 [Umbelopsis isabellina]
MTGMSESFQSFENRVGWTTASQHYINVMYMKQLQVPSRIPEKVTISMQGVMSNSIVLPAESAVGTVRIDQRGVVSSSSNDGSDSEEEPLRRNRKVKCKEKGKEKESNRKKVTTTRERGGVQSIPSSSPKSPSRKRTRSISSTPTGSMSRLRLSTSPTNNRTDFIAYRPRNSSPTLDHQALQSGNNNIDQLEKLFDIS